MNPFRKQVCDNEILHQFIPLPKQNGLSVARFFVGGGGLRRGTKLHTVLRKTRNNESARIACILFDCLQKDISRKKRFFISANDCISSLYGEFHPQLASDFNWSTILCVRFLVEWARSLKGDGANFPIWLDSFFQ